MDLGSFDFRTGKMLLSKLNKNRQRLRYDNNSQNKVRRVQVSTHKATNHNSSTQVIGRLSRHGQKWS